MTELKLSTQRKGDAGHSVLFKCFQLVPWIIIAIYHILIYSTDIYQVSTMCQALVSTLGCSSQRDP